MANLKNLSERIKSVTSIQQVTKAMKMVAAAKVKRLKIRWKFPDLMQKIRRNLSVEYYLKSLQLIFH